MGPTRTSCKYHLQSPHGTTTTPNRDSYSAFCELSVVVAKLFVRTSRQLVHMIFQEEKLANLSL